MIGVFNTIKIDNNEIYRGNDFTLQREMIYAGEIETCTGKRCADLVGWRYGEVTVEWDTLPTDQFEAILDLSGEEVDMEFSDEQGTTVTEKVIPRAITSTVTRFTLPDGGVLWKDIKLQLQFIEAHN